MLKYYSYSTYKQSEQALVQQVGRYLNENMKVFRK